MNAPFLQRRIATGADTLNLFALFHLNLAFSSIEEEQRGDVIAKCYWPLLDLAQKHGPIGIELTGFTLEEIAARDPEWIGRLRALLETGQAELIGSGYSQMIGPLVPAAVTSANLRLGNDIYERLLGQRPRLALVNEQAYSAGLVGLYLDAGYDAILMDWDNPGSQHPEWPADTRYQAQRALGADGRSIGLLWTNTVAFQKLQRFAHNDIDRDSYLAYLQTQRGSGRSLCVYASDAEIFDYRPGRYKTEEANSGNEWNRLAEAFEAIRATRDFRLVAPSDVLAGGGDTTPLSLETARVPVPVKKQRKYNLSRWAVTGRDDTGINAACERIYRGIVAAKADDAAWKELCYLWSSDFRTHITEKRWATYCERLRKAEAQWAKSPVQPAALSKGARTEQRFIDIATPVLTARLDRRRGLAIESLRFASQSRPAIGGLPHGHFDDIALQADWYTGDCVFEAPGEHKITDLEWCETTIAHNESGDVIVSGTIKTPRGPIRKTLTFHADAPQVDFDLTFHWENLGRGSLRLGHFTFLPEALDWNSLTLTTHNGGEAAETFALADQDVEHGAPVSFLVSASHGIGMTEGWADIADKENRIRISVDRTAAPLLGLLTHRNLGGSLFCQFLLSALELDETCKPAPYKTGPRHFRFSVNGFLP
ncbi:MAG TPA: hypothetical protein VHL34_02080 [Rhizomicrobium sp.]|jgi:hypothetical protein|nr:hypothetical protein [Rhizomicrobium sp.]